MAEAFVYFARGRKSKLIKIGTSTRPHLRMAEISCRFQDPMNLLFTLPGGCSLEREMHEKFIDYTYLRRSREWFVETGKLRTFIKSSLARFEPTARTSPSINIKATEKLRRAIIQRMLAHPKLTRQDCVEILGPPFNLSTLRRNY